MTGAGRGGAVHGSAAGATDATAADATGGAAGATGAAGAAGSGEPRLRVEAVGVTIGAARLLDDVTLSASGGQVLALVGPNGAGKSTLLSVISGDREPSAGRVLLTGRPVGEWPAKVLARHRSVMTQHHAQAFSFTVREAVEMGRAPWPVAEDDEDRVQEAMAGAGVAALAEREVTTLSGGELARTVFGRVLAQDAEVVLLDEPTAALDLHHQELVMSRARRLADDGACVVVVLHDLTLAARYCDLVAVLELGRLVAVGDPAEVLTPELIGAVYHHEVVVMTHPRTGRPVVVPA